MPQVIKVLKSAVTAIASPQAEARPRSIPAPGSVSEGEKALNYYRCAVENRRPAYVPARIRLHARVHSDLPFGQRTYADAGEHDCQSNQWGACCVIDNNGGRLGVKPKEFEVIAWRLNDQDQAQARREQPPQAGEARAPSLLPASPGSGIPAPETKRAKRQTL